MNTTLTKNQVKKSTINNLILKLFNKSLIAKEKLSFDEVNKIAIKSGYLIHPDACCSEILDFLKEKKVDYNSTFYKSWNSIIQKSRFELFIDQLLHYASTYGTGFEGEQYIPEESFGIPAFSEFKVINIISEAEVIERSVEMLSSGIALKQETIEGILTIFNYFDYEIDPKIVKNREAKMFICKATNIMPEDPVEMVRFLVYSAIGKSLLIKDKQSLEAIKNSHGVLEDFNKYVKKFGIEKLSSVFYRFKPIFLAFKNWETRTTINKLRKLANKFHVPMKKGYFENLLSDKSFLDQLTPKKLEQISNFKKILLLQTINKRIKELSVNAYVIRNQKLWIKEGTVKTKISRDDLANCFFMIYDSLVESLKGKACKISLPKGINLTLPTSEKSFIGNYPLGTNFDLSDTNAIIGINWKGEDARDIDFSVIDIVGNKIGWNSDYYNSEKSIVYSGDMTSANPEATELIYAKAGFSSPRIVKANVFSDESDAKLKLFFATEQISRMEKNYMVDPNNIIFTVDIEMDSREKTFGILSNNKFTLCNLRTGRGAVSGNSITNLYTQYSLDTIDCYLSLRDVLCNAGFEITDENPDIDLNIISKDSLISLLK